MKLELPMLLQSPVNLTHLMFNQLLQITKLQIIKLVKDVNIANNV